MQDSSFGIVPIRVQNGKLEYLLIQHQIGHWGFPKGHKNHPEEDADTARREFMEETGLQLEQIYHDHSLDESYTFDGREGKVEKTVRYFVGLVKDGEMKLQEIEIKNAGWFNFHMALDRLDYPEAKRILEAVQTEILPKLKLVGLS